MFSSQALLHEAVSEGLSSDRVCLADRAAAGQRGAGGSKASATAGRCGKGPQNPSSANQENTLSSLL